MLFARTITAVAVAITSPAVAAATGVLFAFALGPRARRLARHLEELRRLACRRRWRRPRMLRALLWLLLSMLALRLLASVGTRASIRPPVVTLSLAVALLSVAAVLLEAPLLLAVSLLVTTPVTPVTSSIAALIRAGVAALLVAARITLLRWRLHRRRGGCRRGPRLEQPEDAREEAFGRRRHRLHDLPCRLLRRRGGLRQARRPWQRFVDDRRRLRGRNRLHHGLLALDLRFGALGAGRLRLLRALDHLVARRHVLHVVQLVVAQALHLVVRRLEVRIGHHHDVHLQPALELLDLGALLVQQERGDVNRDLRVHGAGVLLHGLFLHDPQHVQRGGFGTADEAGAAAARAVDVRGLIERRLQTLARERAQGDAR